MNILFVRLFELYQVLHLQMLRSTCWTLGGGQGLIAVLGCPGLGWAGLAAVAGFLGSSEQGIPQVSVFHRSPPGCA